jgi:hypothetical protein
MKNFNLKLRPEELEQKAVIDYLNIKYPNILKTISPEGMRLTIFQGIKYKMLGYTEGTPDILIFEPRGNWHGLFIEMKAPERKYINSNGKLKKARAGKLSQNQKLFIQKALERGYKAVCCIGANEAYKVIDNYLKKGE